MNGSANDVIERTRVREVAAIFHSHEALEAAVEALLLGGVDRADIDHLADLGEVRKRLGPVYVAPEELADVGRAPRQPVVTHDDMAATLAVVVSTLGSFGAAAAALAVVASGGETVTAVVAALAVALVAGGIGAFLTVRVIYPARVKAMEAQMAARGLILWVRVRSPDSEEKARQILREHGGNAIRVHEIEIEKRAEELPLGSLRPDPWLGSERLGQP
jgi:hypothetical protein